MELITFADALTASSDSQPSLLLGNGFSISCEPHIFNYQALFKQADFTNKQEILSVFSALSTYDFEQVIHALEDTAKIAPIYGINSQTSQKLLIDASAIKELLLSTIAHNHPKYPSEIEHHKFWACRKFLRNFLLENGKGRVFTLNYDLLLYWTLMHEDNPFDPSDVSIIRNDGFGEDIDAEFPDYVIWKGESAAKNQRVHYLHGALHLFDDGADLRKYTWNRIGVPLIEQARLAIEKNSYPLFVSEGTSNSKLSKIKHSAYLYHSYKCFRELLEYKNKTLFIHGHSLAANDNHILKLIGRGKMPKIYISIHGDPNSANNKLIYKQADHIKAQRSSLYPLSVEYYDSDSANVWGSLQS